MKSALFVQANVAVNSKLTSKVPFLFGNFHVFLKNLVKNVQFRYARGQFRPILYVFGEGGGGENKSLSPFGLGPLGHFFTANLHKFTSIFKYIPENFTRSTIQHMGVLWKNWPFPDFPFGGCYTPDNPPSRDQGGFLILILAY
jgi:hypothetical protein